MGDDRIVFDEGKNEEKLNNLKNKLEELENSPNPFDCSVVNEYDETVYRINNIDKVLDEEFFEKRDGKDRVVTLKDANYLDISNDDLRANANANVNTISNASNELNDALKNDNVISNAANELESLRKQRNAFSAELAELEKDVTDWSDCLFQTKRGGIEYEIQELDKKINDNLNVIDQQIGSNIDEALSGKTLADMSDEASKKALESIISHMELYKDVDDDYVVRGAVMRCRCGTHQRKLNLPLSHAVFYINENGKHPLVHAMDCVSGDDNNIATFGICKTGTIKNVEHITLKKEVLGEDGLATGKTSGAIRGPGCIPTIVTSWMSTHPDTEIIDNHGCEAKDDCADVALDEHNCTDHCTKYASYEAVVKRSFLVCKYGGLIELRTNGWETDDKEPEVTRRETRIDADRLISAEAEAKKKENWEKFKQVLKDMFSGPTETRIDADRLISAETEAKKKEDREKLKQILKDMFSAPTGTRIDADRLSKGALGPLTKEEEEFLEELEDLYKYMLDEGFAQISDYAQRDDTLFNLMQVLSGEEIKGLSIKGLSIFQVAGLGAWCIDMINQYKIAMDENDGEKIIELTLKVVKKLTLLTADAVVIGAIITIAAESLLIALLAFACYLLVCIAFENADYSIPPIGREADNAGNLYINY